MTYEELCSILRGLGFSEEQNSTSHRKFYKDGVEELINLQEGSAGKAKGYQIKQVRDIVKKYKLKF